MSGSFVKEQLYGGSCNELKARRPINIAAAPTLARRANSPKPRLPVLVLPSLDLHFGFSSFFDGNVAVDRTTKRAASQKVLVPPYTLIEREFRVCQQLLHLLHADYLRGKFSFSAVL